MPAARNEFDNPIDQLREIHRLMERTSKFIGLSGLSGVGAGVFALLGSALAHWYLSLLPVHSVVKAYGAHPWGISPRSFFLLLAAGVLFGALLSGIFFTVRRARKQGQPIWDGLTQQLLLHLAIPLASGGVFCLLLLKQGLFGMVAPATLLFYGLALVSASKFTLRELFYLGILEILLAFTGAIYPAANLLLWTLGFGVLHVIYGLLMYFRYERL